MAMQRKLTNRDMADIFYKLLEGDSVAIIADSYCVSEAGIYERLKNIGVDVSRITAKHRSGIYPVLGRWMAENKIGIDRFSKMLDISYPTLRKFLDGKSSPELETIQKILKVTGMSFEKAFATEETDVREDS